MPERKAWQTWDQYVATLEKKRKKTAENRAKAKRKYNKEHYASVQVFVDKDLAQQFKQRCVDMGVSQAKTITAFMLDFLEQENDKPEDINLN